MDVTLYRQHVELARPIRASAQAHRWRTRLFLRLEHDGRLGYGEVAPQPAPLHGDPSVDEVVEALRRAATKLSEVVARTGELPQWSHVARLSAATSASNAAAALLEMAVLDRELRAMSCSIEALWRASYQTPRQVTFSLLDDEAEWHVERDVERVRVKTTPGQLNRRTLEKLDRLNVPILLDFNCSATSDNEVLHQVEQVDDVATISAVEQPYEVGDIADHARLASRLDVPLSLDEGVRTLRDLAQIAKNGAAEIVCVKPARVGGLGNARTMIAKADELGLRAYLGGFFESPYARRVHRALAHSCISEPSDLDDVALNEGSCEVDPIDSSFGLEPSSAMLTEAEVLSMA